MKLTGGKALVSRRAFISGAAGIGALAVSGSRPFSLAHAAGFVADRPLKIGFIVPLTGPIAPEGEAMQRGLQLGLERLNAAGGIGGKPVELVTQDNQSQPSMAATVAKKFIQQEKVDIIVGTVTFDETTAVRALAARSGTPFVTLEAGSYAAPGTPSLACGASVITLGETVFQMVDPTVPFMTKRFGGKWAFVGSDYQFPRDYIGYAKTKLEAAGGSVLAEEYAPLGTSDWSSIISKLKAANPEVILSSVVGGDAIAFVKAAHSLGLLEKAKITGISLQPEFYPAMGSVVDGQFTVARYTPEIASSSNAAFMQAYKQAHGEGPIPSIASSAYDCWAYIKAAVERAGSFEPAKILAGFDGAQATTILSDEPMTISPTTRDVDYPMYMCEILPGGIWKIAENGGVIRAGMAC